MIAARGYVSRPTNMIQRSEAQTPTEFVEMLLREDQHATYDRVRRAAAERGLAIDPTMYGSIRKRLRAQQLEQSEPVEPEWPRDPEVPTDPPIGESSHATKRDPAVVNRGVDGVEDDAKGGRAETLMLPFAPKKHGSDGHREAGADPGARPRSSDAPSSVALDHDRRLPGAAARPSRSFEPLPARERVLPPLGRASGPAALLEDFMSRVRALEAESRRYRDLLHRLRSDVVATLAEVGGSDH